MSTTFDSSPGYGPEIPPAQSINLPTFVATRPCLPCDIVGVVGFMKDGMYVPSVPSPTFSPTEIVVVSVINCIFILLQRPCRGVTVWVQASR